MRCSRIAQLRLSGDAEILATKCNINANQKHDLYARVADSHDSVCISIVAPDFFLATRGIRLIHRSRASYRSVFDMDVTSENFHFRSVFVGVGQYHRNLCLIELFLRDPVPLCSQRK